MPLVRYGHRGLRAGSLRGVELDGPSGALTHHPREQRPRIVVALHGPCEQRPHAGDRADLELPRVEPRHLRGFLCAQTCGESVNLCNEVGAHRPHVALVERWQHHDPAVLIEACTGHRREASAEQLTLNATRAASVLRGVEACERFNDPCLRPDDGSKGAHVALVYRDRAETLRGADETVNGSGEVCAAHRPTLPRRGLLRRATRLSPRSDARPDARGMEYRR